jgi:uncharacterized protein (DUF1697 family)
MDEGTDQSRSIGAEIAVTDGAAPSGLVNHACVPSETGRIVPVATTSIVLLRGVNVGGRRKISMSDLRSWLDASGFGHVRTYIQSGNVVLEHADDQDLAARIEEVLRASAGFEVSVVTRTAAELARVVVRNPFPRMPPTHLHVAFLAEPPDGAEVRAVTEDAWAPEEFAVRRRDVYLLLPNGMGKARMPPRLRFLSEATIRNWNTIVALSEMARS